MPTENFVPTENVDPAENVLPVENIDPTSTVVAQILEIIPNVEPVHLLQLIETHLPTYSMFRGNGGPDENDGDGAAVAGELEATVEERVQGVVGHVLHLLFENPDYQKAELRAGGKGKRVGGPDDEVGLEGKGKRKAKDSSSKKPKIDYASIDRPFPGGPNYFDLALVCLSLP
jgi:E3 ubiquitin-protein ligase RNF216